MPILIQVVFNSALAYWLNRAVGEKQQRGLSSALIGASDFFSSLPWPLPSALFGFESGAALATVVGVLIEVPVMLLVVKIVSQSKGWYEARHISGGPMKNWAFDPAMCCSTGVCGVDVDPVLAQFAADLKWVENTASPSSATISARNPRPSPPTRRWLGRDGRAWTACIHPGGGWPHRRHRHVPPAAQLAQKLGLAPDDRRQAPHQGGAVAAAEPGTC